MLTVGVKHGCFELDDRCLVRVVFRELKCQAEGSCEARCMGVSCVCNKHETKCHSIPRPSNAALWRTSVPGRSFGPENDGVPQHDVIWVWRPVHALWWVLLQPLEVTHEALRMHARKRAQVTKSRAASVACSESPHLSRGCRHGCSFGMHLTRSSRLCKCSPHLCEKMWAMKYLF